MSARGCRRIWEVEAARDGRLTGNAVEQLERHLARCSVCALEASRFETLGQALKDGHGPLLDEIALARLKSATLEAADRVLTAPPARSRAPWLLAAAVALAALAVGGGVRFARGDRHLSVDVKASPGARWSSRDENGARHVDPGPGTFWIDVSRGAEAPQVVVDLPDGVLLDRGTRFAVEIGASRTLRISVDAGAVEFRRPRMASLRLVAGQSWQAPALAASPARATLDTPAHRAEEVAAPALPSVAPRASASTARPAQVASSRGSAPDRQPEQKTIETDAGDASGATAEDLSYLRIVALVREGRSEEARVAARDYLRRFPDGFRRREVEAIAK